MIQKEMLKTRSKHLLSNRTYAISLPTISSLSSRDSSSTRKVTVWGVEYPIEDGRIDILAIDKNERPVVIELKVSHGRNRTIGQLLY